VHPDDFSESAGPVADGVKGFGACVGVPFEFGEAGVIFGVNDGEFAAGERDCAIGITETQTAIYKGGFKNQPFQPRCDFDDNFDIFPRFLILDTTRRLRFGL
jgi:hypothetical protein